MVTRTVMVGDDVRLACHIAGESDAPPMVLLHALGEQAASWDDVVPEFTPFFQVTAPTLLIGGGPTSHVPQDRLGEVARLIPGCTLITFPVGHHVHEAQPEEFAAATLGWLGLGPLAES